MIKRRLKVCSVCKAQKYIFSQRMCESCWKLKNHKPIKASKSINPVSRNQRKRNNKYLELRFIYLKEHPLCEVEGCTHKATEIHHKAGRTGDSLYMYFLAVCNECHRRIEENPDWAKENGYSISRLK
jgi:hypothetical protein